VSRWGEVVSKTANNGASILCGRLYGRGAEERKDEVTACWSAPTDGSACLDSPNVWYFGLALQKHLKTPIALITASIADSRLEAWLPLPEFNSSTSVTRIWWRHRQALATVSPIIATNYQRKLRSWLKANPTPALQFENSKTHPTPPHTVSSGHVTNRFYNGMSHGAQPYTLYGIIWHSDESDAPHPKVYPGLAKGPIPQWNVNWHQDLHCYYLAPDDAEPMTDNRICLQ
jgi:hypothetical protein